jgi:DNA-binding response OmpR family regulator
MSEAALTAVVIDDQTSSFDAIRAVLDDAGFLVVVRASTFSDGAVLTAAMQPDVAVLDLALTGLEGLGALHVLHTAAPTCATIVLSPFESLEPAAQSLGAAALVDPHDLRALGDAADAIRRQRVAVPAQRDGRDSRRTNEPS